MSHGPVLLLPFNLVLQAPYIFNREPSQSEVSEIPAEQQQEQQPQPKPRRKLFNEMEHGRSRSGGHAGLLQELERLTKENQELTTNLQQLSRSSQDSGFQHSK
jgi:hypothetical protein